MKARIYIAGKVTGLPWEPTVAKFAAAKLLLEARGVEAVNPIELVNDPHAPWEEAMRICLLALKDCTGIYMLPCSVDSRGAQIELQTAMELGISIDWSDE